MANGLRQDSPIDKRVREAALAALKEFGEPDAARRSFLKRFHEFSVHDDPEARDRALRIFKEAQGEGLSELVGRQYDIVTIPQEDDGGRRVNFRLFEVDRGWIKPVMDLNEDGTPKVNAYMLFLPNEVTGNAVLVRSDEKPNSHLSCIVKVKEQYGLTDITNLGNAMVSLIIRGRGDDIYCGVRSDPVISPEQWVEKNRLATEVLTSFGVPLSRIRVFSCLDERVWEEFMRNGELHMLYPPSTRRRDEERFIEESYHHRIGGGEILAGGNTDPGIEVYHSPGSGERFMTWSDLDRMADEFASGALSRAAVSTRVDTMASMMNAENRQGVPELTLFGALSGDYRRGFSGLNSKLKGPMSDEEAKAIVRSLADSLRGGVDPLLREYDPDRDYCREAMYRSLQRIPLDGERRLGLGREYYASVQWLPGARTVEGNPVYAADADPVARGMIEDYHKAFPQQIEYINIGRTLKSQSRREKLGEEDRDVYLIQYKLLSDEEPRLEVVRKKKLDAEHFFTAEGLGVEESAKKAREYGAYVHDRVDAFRLLGVKIPEAYDVGWDERIPHTSVTLPREFMARKFVPGPATDKLNPGAYRSRSFMGEFESSMGRHAAANMILGRTLFDDGDEVLAGGMPGELHLTDMTQSFRDIDSEYNQRTRTYSSHVARTVGRMTAYGGYAEQEAMESAESFYVGFRREFLRIRDEYGRNREEWRRRYERKVAEETQSGKRPEPSVERWDIRGQWGRVLDRLEGVRGPEDVDRIVDAMKAETERAMQITRAALGGLLPEDEPRVLAAMNELLSTHPDKVDEALAVVRADAAFNMPENTGAQELGQLAIQRSIRLRMLRVSYLAERLGHRLGEVEAYAVQARQRSHNNALEAFEDNVGSKFRGLHLTVDDAAMLLQVAEDPALRQTLTSRGYIRG